jgi:nicotinic acid mononucleotide adenylyltransferase
MTAERTGRADSGTNDQWIRHLAHAMRTTDLVFLQEWLSLDAARPAFRDNCAAFFEQRLRLIEEVLQEKQAANFRRAERRRKRKGSNGGT